MASGVWSLEVIFEPSLSCPRAGSLSIARSGNWTSPSTLHATWHVETMAVVLIVLFALELSGMLFWAGNGTGADRACDCS